MAEQKRYQKPTHMTVLHEDGSETIQPVPADLAAGIGKVIDELNSITPLDHTTEVYHCSPTMGCGRPVTRKEMASWDRDTLVEFNRLRWCKECQDKFFNDDAEDEDDISTWSDGTPMPEEVTIMHCNCDSADVGIGVIYEMRPDCPFHGRRNDERPDSDRPKP